MSEVNPGTALPISLWWLECVDDELSAFAVNILSLTDVLNRFPKNANPY
jgi:hypothetical protein